jgi:probable HAF family extracellular repeat protein
MMKFISAILAATLLTAEGASAKKSVRKNTAPTISDIAAQSISEGSSTGTLAFTINDTQTASSSLKLSASSSNTKLVPKSSIVFGGSGENRTVTVTPIKSRKSRTGKAKITVTVSDGKLRRRDTFVLTVNANTAPTISDIAAQTINEGGSTGVIGFTIGDAHTTAGLLGLLTLSGNSSDTTLIPNANIVFGGSGANRTVTVTPTSGQTGTATITVTVSDGSLTRSDTFVLTVNAAPANTAPTISDIAAQTIDEGGTTGPIAFTIGDAQTASSSLTLSGSSSNTTLVPKSNIVFGGSGANRTVMVTPAGGQSGTATITVTVSDGSLSTSDTFVLMVNPAPTGMVDLGVLPGYTDSAASGVSGDGNTVVGYSMSPQGNRAFRWTAAGGMSDMGVLLGSNTSYADGVSADGGVVVGTSDDRAFRWTAAGRMSSLGALPGHANSYAHDISADGSVVVGYSRKGGENRAFRWTAAGGMTDLGTLPSQTYSEAYGVSADGDVVVGASGNRAFIWTAVGGMVDLGALPGQVNSYASGISADGNVVVGYSTGIYGQGGYRAFRWTAAGGMVDLGTLPDNNTSYISDFPTGVSADGSVVVGFSSNKAFRWTAAGGMVDLGALPGDDVPYSLYYANGVSHDGRIVVGFSQFGTNPIQYRAFRWIAPDPATPIRMSLIPAGSFTMGNSLTADADITDAPTRTVHLDAYYMSKYEVSKAVWDEVRNWAIINDYTDLTEGTGKASNHPVHSISWYDMVKWCNARSQKDGLTPVYYTNDAQTSIYKTGNVDVTNAQVKWAANGYRLPTEAEWEKAARGGLIGKRFPWGDTINHSQANYYANGADTYDLGESGYHASYATNAMPYLSPTGSFAANGYGLHDMAGNVFEWCWDWYAMYSTGSQINPRGPATGIAGFGTGRVLRSGSWGANASYSRSAYRDYINPSSTGYTGIGFRVVRSSTP